MKYRVLFPTLLAISLNLGCGKNQIEDPTSSRPASTILVTEDSATKTTGTFDVNSTQSQVLVVNGNPAIRDSAIIIAPGTLNVGTDVSITAGADQNAAIAAALGIQNNAIAGGTTPINTIPSAPTAALNAPMTISLPLPVTSDNLGTTKLLATNGKLVALYLYKTATGYRAGIKVLGSNDFLGTFARFSSPRFGWFAIVYFAAAVDDKEVDVTIEPKSR